MMHIKIKSLSPHPNFDPLFREYFRPSSYTEFLSKWYNSLSTDVKQSKNKILQSLIVIASHLLMAPFILLPSTRVHPIILGVWTICMAPISLFFVVLGLISAGMISLYCVPYLFFKHRQAFELTKSFQKAMKELKLPLEERGMILEICKNGYDFEVEDSGIDEEENPKVTLIHGLLGTEYASPCLHTISLLISILEIQHSAPTVRDRISREEKAMLCELKKYYAYQMTFRSKVEIPSNLIPRDVTELILDFLSPLSMEGNSQTPPEPAPSASVLRANVSSTSMDSEELNSSRRSPL